MEQRRLPTMDLSSSAIPHHGIPHSIRRIPNHSIEINFCLSAASLEDSHIATATELVDAQGV